jgi:NADH-quinone oxidoreductase subunit E
MTENMTWSAEEKKQVDQAIDLLKDEANPLISVLQRVQTLFGYLPLDAMDHISRVLRIPRAEIYGVATFYAQFSFEPKGRHIILSCQGTACHVRGGGTILEEMKRDLKIEEGHTTKDGRFSLEKVYCVGCCSLAPAIIINKRAYGKLAPGSTKRVLAQYT